MRSAAYWLLAAAIVCVAASYGIERFGFELCHQGLPLALLAIGTPVAGAITGLAALLHRPRVYILVIGLAAVAANAYYLARALHTLMGAGFASCG
jgi:hypothetical protein